MSGRQEMNWPGMCWRLACFRFSAGALRIDIALLPGLGSVLW